MQKLIFKNDKDIFNTIAIFFVFLFRINGYLYENEIAFLCIIGVSVFGILINITEIKKTPCIYFIWFGSFLILFLISIFWSIDRRITGVNFIATFARAIIYFYICSNLISVDGAKKIITLFSLACVINTILIYIIYGPNVLVMARVNGIQSGAGNNNSVGQDAAIAIVLLFIKDYCINKKFPIRDKVSDVILLSTVLTSGSKTALLVLVIPISIIFIIFYKNKLLKALFVLCSLLVILLLIMNVPLLYRMVGERLLVFIRGILGQINENYGGDLSVSDRTRLYMLKVGLEWIKERPLIGHGMSTYKVLYGQIASNAMYSHNNYIEIGVGMGIIGILQYYCLYIYLLVKSICRKNTVTLSIILLFIIIDFSSVSYLVQSMQLLIMIACYFVEKEPHLGSRFVK